MENTNTKDIRKLFDKHEELHVMVSKLSVMTKSGFDGIEKRQNITNGRIGELESETSSIKDVAESNCSRLDSLEGIHDDRKESRRWLKREVVVSLLAIIQVVLTAIILLVLGLKG